MVVGARAPLHGLRGQPRRPVPALPGTRRRPCVLQTYAPGDPIQPPGAWEVPGFLEDSDGNHWARFGFAVLDLDGGQMQVRYRDDTGAQIRSEVIE